LRESSRVEAASRVLVESAMHGDRAAIARLLEQNLPRLRAYVRLNADPNVRQHESCSDLVQSVCKEVLEHMGTLEYRGEGLFRAWLFQAALNKIQERRRFHRAGKRDRAREDRRSRLLEEELHECYGAIASPSRVAMARESVQRMEAAFDGLPEEYREVIVLSRIVGLSRKEVAERMHRSEGSVAMLLSRALLRLVAVMDRMGGRR
jgi:RNA polymerase sigma-70 factor (ECF subfamily)